MAFKVVFAQKAVSEAVALLDSRFSTALLYEGDEASFEHELADADAVVLGTGTRMDSKKIMLAKKLKVISRTGIGVDNVDIAAATERGIYVLNVTHGNTISVAEHTVALIGALAKSLFVLDANVRDGNFKIRRQGLSTELDGKTLSLIGLGAIGSLVANKCRMAFGMRVLAYDPYVDVLPEHVEICSMDQALREADVVSLHLPFLPSTRHIVDEDALGKMKSTAYLVNTSRGGTVDEAALIQALKDRRIAGAALDVFENEPLERESPFTGLPNVILTPHAAGLTKECSIRLSVEAVRGVIDVLQGMAPKSVYNRQGLKERGVNV